MEASRPSRAVSGAIRLGFILVALAAFLALSAPPNGHDHGQIWRFLGRFHPVIVHLPIGLLVMVPVLELAGLVARRGELKAAAGFVLGFAAAGAVISALDGWLLAWSGGYAGPNVIRHMWSGVALAALTLGTWAVRSAFPPSRLRHVFVYWPLLLVTLGVLGWTGHEGGQLTHGPGYLTEYMPARLRAWLRVPPAPAPAPKPAQPSGAKPKFYAARIDPILERSCISCHGPDKRKGGLRLDSYAGIMRGGEDGPVVDPWYPKESEIVRRVTLPPDDDDFMPSDGKHPLSPDEIRTLERWIAAGASPTEPADAAPGAVQ